MNEFARALAVQEVLEHVHEYPQGAIAWLFENWAIPGQNPSAGKLGLRLAVRADYANFYVSGQSVAKLSTSRKNLCLETHPKYHGGTPNRTQAGASGARYCRFSRQALRGLTANDVARWAATAATYATAQKSFVERLVASNANIIDLETALPGKPAPRMDITVVSERDGDSVIGFWEAKCIDNKELRSSSVHDAITKEGGPHIFEQARNYSDWLGVDEQRRSLAEAYRNAAQILVQLVDGLSSLDRKRFGHLVERADIPMLAAMFRYCLNPAGPTDKQRQRIVAARANLLSFLRFSVATWARPDAALDASTASERGQWDSQARVFRLNPVGRRQTKKRRATVPVVNCVGEWLDTIDGPVCAKAVSKATWRRMQGALGIPFEGQGGMKLIRRSIMTAARKRLGEEHWAQGRMMAGHVPVTVSDVYALPDPANLGRALAVTQSIITDIETLAPGAFTAVLPHERLVGEGQSPQDLAD